MFAEIERAAGELFREIGMASIADDEPFSAEELTPFVESGRAWVATEGSDLPIAYILVLVIDGGAHIEQVSVHQDHAYEGIGAALIEAVAEWGRRKGLAAVTLTTFADVPWSAPYYGTLGFEQVPLTNVTPGLAGIYSDERRGG